jgi:trehalose 6-phosphate synthase/phosphatase
MRDVVQKNDVNKWMNDFMTDVNNARKNVQWNRPNFMSFYEKMDLFDAYRAARKRLILLDYDGTLIPFYNKPEEAVPGDVIKDLVSKLVKNKRNKVMLISGRDGETLENWFRNSKIDIAAEHGTLYKPAEQDWIVPNGYNMSWKEDVKICIDKYVQLIPGSFVEEKKFSVAWHYRAIENIDEEATKLALSKELMMLNMNNDFDILHGNKVIEIKSIHTNKGKFITRFLEHNEFDFVLAIGDDVTDEDMFNALKEKHHYTIKVGLGKTAARYNLVGVNNVLSFLEQLTTFKEPIAR